MINCLPENLRKDEILSTAYSLSNTIRNKDFNYKKTIKNINTNNNSIYDTSIISCYCTNCKYLNHHHGQIITKDLWIIENKRTCNIISKGPNYRERKTINWKKLKKT